MSVEIDTMRKAFDAQKNEQHFKRKAVTLEENSDDETKIPDVLTTDTLQGPIE